MSKILLVKCDLCDNVIHHITDIGLITHQIEVEQHQIGRDVCNKCQSESYTDVTEYYIDEKEDKQS